MWPVTRWIRNLKRAWKEQRLGPISYPMCKGIKYIVSIPIERESGSAEAPVSKCVGVINFDTHDERGADLLHKIVTTGELAKGIDDADDEGKEEVRLEVEKAAAEIASMLTGFNGFNVEDDVKLRNIASRLASRFVAYMHRRGKILAHLW